MALHSFKIPIHPLPLDSTVLDRISKCIEILLGGQPNLRCWNPAAESSNPFLAMVLHRRVPSKLMLFSSAVRVRIHTYKNSDVC
jgi:hypothetical protein